MGNTDEEKKIQRRYTQLLDWKLDFLNPVYTEFYEKEYNAAEVPLARAAIAVGASSFLITIIAYFIEGGSTLKIKPYIFVLAYSAWYAIWLPLYYVEWVKRHCGTITCFVLAAVPLIVNIGYIYDQEIYNYNSVILNLSLFSLMAPLVLRLHVKFIIVLSIVDIIIFATTVIVFEDESSAEQRLAIFLPTLFNFVLGIYCGYISEKRLKFDFFRRQLVAAEAAKLQWIVARDASLLRNIFPKNLSDELEKRVVDEPTPATFTPSASVLRVVSKKVMELRDLRSHSGKYELTDDHDSDLDRISISLPNEDSFLGRSRANTQVGGKFPALSVVIPLSTSIRGSPFKPSFLSPSKFTFSSSSSSSSSFESSMNLNLSPVSRQTSLLNFPPVVTTPCKTPDFSSSDVVCAPYDMMAGRVITTSGSPLHTSNFQPELQTFLTGTRHNDGSPIALSHSYPQVTVIFADIVGFTSLSSSITPQELVVLLNNLFSEFDDIMDFHHLEKIRTVGDAYLCAGNMSVPLYNHEEEGVRAARKMIAEVHRISSSLSLRVGITSGPLIAGVTGATKWNYDIFGKPLSHANLMETMAPPDCIVVSQSIYDACKNNPEFYFEKIENEGNTGYLMKRERELYVPTTDYSRRRLEIQDSLMYLTQPILERVHQEILDESFDDIMEYSDSRNFESSDNGELPKFSNIREISNSSSNLTSNSSPEDGSVDIEKKFGYSREDLEREEKNLSSTWVVFKFLNQEFETEFTQKSIRSLHIYTRYLMFLFSLSLIVIILSDVASGSIDTFVIIISACAVSVLLLYVLYAKFMDTHPASDYVAAFTALCYVLSLVFIYNRIPSGRHLTFIMLTVISVSSFVRVPLHLLIVVQTVYCVISMVILILNTEFGGYHVAVSAILFLFLVTSCLSQRSVQRSLRQQFLFLKTIQVNMFLQRVSQRRAKLLIRNILPEDIISRLQNMKQSVGVVDMFEQATIMFICITNLVELTQDLDASSAFQVYNELFTQLDQVISSYGLEKIKTINNVYMVASGLPKKIPNHADIAVQVAIEAYRVVSQYSFPLIDKKFRVRIGLASGPVIAGIIGKKKYAYDCWSDTTNTASRMESNSWLGYLQVSPHTFELLKQRAHFEKRENLNIKGKGIMDTYVLALKKFAPKNVY